MNFTCDFIYIIKTIWTLESYKVKGIPLCSTTIVTRYHTSMYA